LDHALLGIKVGKRYLEVGGNIWKGGVQGAIAVKYEREVVKVLLCIETTKTVICFLVESVAPFTIF
jgi:hypothetical protein